ncbi:hypothetical protein RD792_016409 [Penstemon davidsonii]|uniref:3-oxo-5-alpha-steroid 4-dehydrogenase C-terminal domain-containing protein n=1 Tax=Penstemon davidsonii TaxID=160366 RepID=A0ABR0CJD2_9LAMI|nr:hypothetical protein RD792_016409 [Penstemon davidsonii]
MYGRKASELVKELASSEPGQLSSFNNDLFAQVLEECNGHLHHLQPLMRYNRAEVIRSLGWMCDRVLPAEIEERLSSTEEEYFKNHAATLQSYMGGLDLDLTVDGQCSSTCNHVPETTLMQSSTSLRVKWKSSQGTCLNRCFHFALRNWDRDGDFGISAPLSLCCTHGPEVFKFVTNLFAEFVVKGKDRMQVTELDLWGLVNPFMQLKWYVWIGAAIFSWGWIHQRSCHLILGSLRENGRQRDDYAIPYGDWFEYVSSPHYLAELVTNLTLAASETQKWYLRKFDNYPRNRFAIIPFIY